MYRGCCSILSCPVLGARCVRSCGCYWIALKDRIEYTCVLCRFVYSWLVTLTNKKKLGFAESQLSLEVPDFVGLKSASVRLSRRATSACPGWSVKSSLVMMLA